MVESNPFGFFRKVCAESIKSALTQRFNIAPDTIMLETPPSPEMGDLAFPCFTLTKQLRANPAQIARQLAEALEALKPPAILKVNAMGGYVNLHFDYTELAGMTLESLQEKGEEYGQVQVQSPLRIIVEHTSANPVHPLHLGTTRNAILGDSIARLLKSCGHTVSTHFYIDDVGRQVAVAAYGYGLLGAPEPEGKPDTWIGAIYAITNCAVEIKQLKEELARLGEDAEPTDRQPLLQELDDWVAAADDLSKRHPKEFERLTDAIAKETDPLAAISRLDRDYEKGEGKAATLMRRICEYSIAGFQATLKRAGIEFDSWDWEGEITSWSGRTEEAVKKLEKTPFAYHEGGALAVDVDAASNKLGLRELFSIPSYELAPLTLLRSDGRTLYPARDTAYALWQLERADKVVRVIAVDQTLPQLQLKIALCLMGKQNLAERLGHFSYEMVNFAGAALSGRRGRFIALDDVMNEAVHRAMIEVEKRSPITDPGMKEGIAEAVGVGAVKYSMLALSAGKPLTFEWSRVLDFERNSGPFIQYSYARAANILAKARSPARKCRPELLTIEVERRLTLLLAKFPQVVQDAAENLRPEAVAEFINEIATTFNSFYDSVPVLKASPTELRDTRMHLVEGVMLVLRKGLDVLGIAAPTRM